MDLVVDLVVNLMVVMGGLVVVMVGFLVVVVVIVVVVVETVVVVVFGFFIILTTFLSISIFCLLSCSNKGANPIRPLDFARTISGLLIVMISDSVNLGSFLSCFVPAK